MTHTFEINMAGTGIIEGELSFNGPNNPPHVKIASQIDTTTANLKRVALFLEQLIALYRNCGDIQSIEINKKE